MCVMHNVLFLFAIQVSFYKKESLRILKELKEFKDS